MVRRPVPPLDRTKRLRRPEEMESRFYLRLQVSNQPGVFAQITGVLGTAGISLASVIQKEERDAGRIAEVVLATYKTREDAMQRAVQALSALDAVDEISNVIRIED